MGKIFAALLFTCISAHSAVYYVDRKNIAANDTNPGTAQAPWLTMQHATTVASGGDTVIVMPGTYQRIRFDSSGNSVSNGMYLFRMTIGQKVLQRKVLLLK